MSDIEAPQQTADIVQNGAAKDEAVREPRVRRLNIIGARNWFFLASLLIIIPGIVSMATQGFLLGIDFQGGTEFVLKFKNNPSLNQVQSAVTSEGVSGVVQQTGTGSYIIRTGTIDPNKQ